MSIYKKIFRALAFIGIVPLVLYTIISSIIVLNEIREHNTVLSMEELQNIDSEVSTLLETAENEVMTLSENLLLQYESDQDFTNFINADEDTFEYNITDEEQQIIDLLNAYRLNHSYMNSVYYGTINGAFVRSHPRARSTSYDPRVRIWYKLAVQNPNTVQLTEPYKSVTTNDINLGTVKAVHDKSGILIGVVGADITLEKLSLLTTDFEGYNQPYNIIISDQNIIMSHPDGTLLFEDASVLDFTLPMYDETSDELYKVEENGISKVVFSYHSTTTGWYYYRVIPSSILNEKSNELIFYSILLIVSLVIIIFLATIKFSKFLSSRIKSISDVMEKVGEGDLSMKVVDKWDDELSIISLELNNMLTRIKDAQYQIIYKDSETNLDNHVKLQEILQGERKSGYLLQVHISNLLLLTQIYGYEQATNLTREITKLLQSNMDEDTFLTRITTTSFVFLSYNNINKKEISKIANTLIKNLSKVFHIGQSNIFLEHRLGCIYLNNNLPVKELLVNLNLTTMGHNPLETTIQFYDVEKKDAILMELTIEKELNRALERNEFYPVFQPIIDLSSGEIYGYEILIRWKNRELGVVYPDNFIPIAEKNKSIVEIGEFILKSAIKFGQEYKKKYGKSIMMSVNISVVQLYNDNIYQLIEQLLKENNYDPKYLILELTETMFYKTDKELLKILLQIKKLGVKISLDDFGSGFSSINNLLRLPIDYLKIDKQFFWYSLENENAATMVEMILDYTAKTGINVVVEGIETRIMEDKVKEYNAIYGQGYYYSLPVKSSKILK